MSQNKSSIKRLLARVSYAVVLLSTSGLVLVQFLYPHWGPHVGINDYDRASFMEMVEGDAYKPFVMRMLLPTTVRFLSAIAPEAYQSTLADQVVKGDLLSKTFSTLGWESQAAFQYFLALILMYLSLIGFGHSVVLLTEQTCNIPKDTKTKIIILISSLMGVTFLFRYVSYIYDPPQLFLFTLALYLLSTDRIKLFFIVFVFCCLNKETAILLIPLFALKYYGLGFQNCQYGYSIGGLVIIYLSIRTALFFIFYDNPGSFLESQFSHNVWWITSGRTLGDVIIIILVVMLVVFRWRKKPLFLRVAFLSVLLPLVSMAVFLGYIDEWRGYYEAYPLGLGLAVHSFLEVQKSFTSNPKASRIVYSNE